MALLYYISKKNNKGFSLIELSIVLIIMGLLVAGVTGGASLIKSAKLRSVINEIREYSTAFNTYYSIHYRVPGSTETNKDCIGNCDWLSSLSSQAWQELKDEGLIDKEIGYSIGWNERINYVLSKYGNNMAWFWHVENNFRNGITEYMNKYRLKNVLIMNTYNFEINFIYKDYISIDEKIDDGNYQTGKLFLKDPRDINLNANTACSGFAVLQDIN